MNRLYLVAGGLFVFAIVVVVKLVDIQMIKGEDYKELALNKTEKMFTIEPNRGNLYSDDGSLLAASVPKYEIRFDAKTVSEDNFQEHVAALSDSLGNLFNKPSSYYRQLFRKARANNPTSMTGIYSLALPCARIARVSSSEPPSPNAMRPFRRWETTRKASHMRIRILTAT